MSTGSENLNLEGVRRKLVTIIPESVYRQVMTAFPFHLGIPADNKGKIRFEKYEGIGHLILLERPFMGPAEDIHSINTE